MTHDATTQAAKERAWRCPLHAGGSLAANIAGYRGEDAIDIREMNGLHIHTRRRRERRREWGAEQRIKHA